MQKYMIWLINRIIKRVQVAAMRKSFDNHFKKMDEERWLDEYVREAIPIVIRAFEEYPVQASGIDYVHSVEYFNRPEQKRQIHCTIYHSGFNRFKLEESENSEKPKITLENYNIESIIRSPLISPFATSKMHEAKQFIKKLSERTGINLEKEIEKSRYELTKKP